LTLGVTEQGDLTGDPEIVCVHGVGQTSDIYERLGKRLAERGARVVAMDLRGYGKSTREPPWDTETQVRELEETAEHLRLRDAVWIGHSYGARVIATLAATAPERVRGLVLLDPATSVDPPFALERAEIERMDWSFATSDGAIAALAGPSVPASARPAIEEYVRNNVVKGSDGRLRFDFSPCAAVVAWNEMARPHPKISGIDVLLVRAGSGQEGGLKSEVERYGEIFGPALRVVTVPNGHNVLWEAPEETAAAIEGFLAEHRQKYAAR
jgi:lipase